MFFAFVKIDCSEKSFQEYHLRVSNILGPDQTGRFVGLGQNRNCLQRYMYSKTCLKRPLSKRPNFGFQDQLSLNAGRKYCRMFQGEHSAILST